MIKIVPTLLAVGLLSSIVSASETVCPHGSTANYHGVCVCATPGTALLPDRSACVEIGAYSQFELGPDSLVCTDGNYYNPYIYVDIAHNIGTCMSGCSIVFGESYLEVEWTKLCVTTCPPGLPYIDTSGAKCVDYCGPYAVPDSVTGQCTCKTERGAYLSVDGTACVSVGDEGCDGVFGTRCIEKGDECPSNTANVTADLWTRVKDLYYEPDYPLSGAPDQLRVQAISALVGVFYAGADLRNGFTINPENAPYYSALNATYDVSMIALGIAACLINPCDAFVVNCESILSDLSTAGGLRFSNGMIYKPSLSIDDATAADLATGLFSVCTPIGDGDYSKSLSSINLSVLDDLAIFGAYKAGWFARVIVPTLVFSDLSAGKPADPVHVFDALAKYTAEQSIGALGFLYAAMMASMNSMESYDASYSSHAIFNVQGSLVSAIFYAEEAQLLAAIYEQYAISDVFAHPEQFVNFFGPGGLVPTYEGVGTCVCPTGTYPSIDGTTCVAPGTRLCPAIAVAGESVVCTCASDSQRWNVASGRCVDVSCLAGEIVNAVGECIDCPDGQSSRIGSQKCFWCLSGTWSSGVSGLCEVCPSGSVRPDINGGCMSCKAYWVTYLGHSEQTMPRLTSSSDGTACVRADCDVNQYGSSATTCTDCPLGTVSSGNSTKCTACPSGYYTRADDVGVLHCVPAPAGTCVDTTTGAGVTQCQKGTYSKGVATACTMCAAGSYNSKVASTGCTKCPNGQYSSDDGSLSCSTCPYNSLSTADGRDCVKDCPSGSYGTSVVLGNAVATCVPCAPGTYSGPSNAAGHCTPCPAGTYTPTQGMSSCLSCLAGNVSDPGSSFCAPCPAGFVPDPVDSTCVPCWLGSYSNTSDTVCTACSPGTYAPFPGSQRCEPCPAGTFMPYTGAFGCIVCGEDRFTTSIGADECPVCPLGTSRPISDMLGCADIGGIYSLDYTKLERHVYITNKNDDEGKAAFMGSVTGFTVIVGSVVIAVLAAAVYYIVKKRQTRR